jgi:hypothetical protein
MMKFFVMLITTLAAQTLLMKTSMVLTSMVIWRMHLVNADMSLGMEVPYIRFDM